MYQQVLDPVSHSLGLSSIFAVLPLVSLFVLLGGLKWKAQWAALASLVVALIVAIAVYSMPVGQAVDSGFEGAVFGLFPIMWIVVNALWIYNVTVETGHFEVLRRSFSRVSPDLRIQVIIIAFCFGSLLEALAGFGTPVAICATMLIALGVKPIKAAALALVADTAPVAFGAIAIPITTLSQTSGLPEGDLGAMVGRQTPLLALLLPFILAFMVDGRKGLREIWPAALVAGLVFAVAQFACSNYVSIQLTDIVAALLSAAALVGFLRLWSPGGERVTAPAPAIAGASAHDPELERKAGAPDSRRTVIEAYAPYAIIIVVFALAQGPLKNTLDSATKEFAWPGLHVNDVKGEAVSTTTFKFDWALAAGSLLFVAGLVTMLVLRVGPGRAIKTYGKTLSQLKWAILTVSAVLGLAYVMNLSGQTLTLGTWLAGAGSIFAFFSGIIGWIGVSVTGSDTSSNALFGALQVKAAKEAGLSELLMAATNSSGGVLGKMISPQNLAIGAAAVGMAGKEGDLFREVVKWSVGLLLLLCVLALLQSTGVLSWMVP